MLKNLFYFICVFLVAGSGCTTYTNQNTSKSPQVPIYDDVQNFFNICNDAVPHGWYIKRLTLTSGPQPRTFQGKIDAIQSEIDDLEMELMELQDKCGEN
jgi:hypothetical protein